MTEDVKLSNELVQKMQAYGGTIVLETGHSFDFVLCLELEKLVKSGSVKLVQKTETFITYGLKGNNDKEIMNDNAEYEKPHFLAITFEMNGRNWRGKIVNINNDNLDVIYRDINGDLAHTRINPGDITS